jgi:hypothetical protein
MPNEYPSQSYSRGWSRTVTVIVPNDSRYAPPPLLAGPRFLADTWQRERQQGIVVGGGHDRFCPGAGVGVSTQSLQAAGIGAV